MCRKRHSHQRSELIAQLKFLAPSKELPDPKYFVIENLHPEIATQKNTSDIISLLLVYNYYNAFVVISQAFV
jgi:sulfur relay (sulfurtransferase) DsrF/TusC family protein